jgi:hypothetical protein
MERRLVDPERIHAIRRSVAVTQTVARADEVRVTYWLDRYASSAESEWQTREAPQARARQGEERMRKKAGLAEGKISATG